MTYEQTLLAAFVAAFNESGMSRRELTRRLSDRFGVSSPSFRTVDRILAGEHRMSIQQAEMLCAVLGVNMIDVLGGSTPGAGAQYRCILPLVPPVENMQVRGLVPDRRRDVMCPVHAL